MEGWAQTEHITAVDSEEPPNAGPQPTNPNSSDGSPQEFATDPEHQTHILDAEAEIGPNPSGLGAMLNFEVQPPARSDPPLIRNANLPTNGPATPPIPAPQIQPDQSDQQPTASIEPGPTPGASSGREGTEAHKYQCDSCDKSFRRPYLLDDHKRTHSGEETRGEC